LQSPIAGPAPNPASISDSLEASDNLPDPDVIAQEIVDDLESALEQFRLIATDLGEDPSGKTVG
jgi:type I restriction enzyme M protein